MLRRLLPPLFFGLAGAAVLVWLGVWQLQRLEWKEGMLAEIEARIGGTTVSLPETVDPTRDRFLPVRVSGMTEPGEVLVQASRKGYGPGFRVVTPLSTAEGRRILLDRGFIPATARNEDRPPVALSVEGNLHWPDEVDRFTPAPDPEAGLWFARDVPGLAAALGTEPVLLVARRTNEDPQIVEPLPVDTVGIPNDHREYAITWFLLAIVWLGMTGLLLRTRLRGLPREV